MNLFRPIAVLAAAAVSPQVPASVPAPIQMDDAAPAATRYDYLRRMITCDEKDEAAIDEVFNAFISLLATGELRKGELRLPAHLTTRVSDMVAFERAFYLTPNVLRSFELVVPSSSLKEEGGMLVSVSALTVSQRGGIQGNISVTLKPKQPNQALQPTAPSGRG